MADSILRLPSVKSRTGLSRSTIYLRMSQGDFPKPVKLGTRAVGWSQTSIETATVNGLEPHAYLSHLFAELPKATTLDHYRSTLALERQARAATAVQSLDRDQ